MSVNRLWCGLLILTTACATVSEDGAGEIPPDSTRAEESRAEVRQPSPGTVSPARGSITMQIERTPLGLALRQLGETGQGGVVLMNGIDTGQFVGPFEWKDVSFDRAVRELAGALPERAAVNDAGGYYFIYPDNPVYESLNQVSLGGALHPRYGDVVTSAAFGVDIPLFNAFALLGHALDLTIVGDNAIVAQLAGEISLHDVALEQVIEALLKSARMIDPVFRVESTEEYIFISHAHNVARPRMLLNESALSAEARETLEGRVDLILPMAPSRAHDIEGAPGASLLGSLLPSISEQLGVRVKAEPGLDRLPVNPMVVHNVRLRTAIELLIRQWLSPEFGYEWRDGGIVLRHAGAP